ncbi:hypothetical protein [Ruegeria arenilitoris]|uniref:hypothetical protein n=1 Tax=Ruegeria arenilitoris TaxID=1173585 RepID=UPI00147B869C|nr:hypothetical protein [Ruegeria arenilitoris]MBY6083638.1 hypothetical protein [Ruegeria arenilitoris]
MKRSFWNLFTPALAISGTAALAMSDADDACIDHLRQVGGPDGQSGTIESSQFSEAGTLVMLRDAGGTLWRCIAYKDGSIGEMSVVEAMDDGGGAMDGASGSTGSQRVTFDAGSTGAELVGQLAPGESQQYVLGAKNEQFLYVRVAPRNGSLDYVIRNPDGSELLGLMSADKEYRGQLWQSGDHVVEVINRGSSAVDYNVIFGIE